MARRSAPSPGWPAGSALRRPPGTLQRVAPQADGTGPAPGATPPGAGRRGPVGPEARSAKCQNVLTFGHVDSPNPED